MKWKTAVLGIDIQNDFTHPTGALYVKGADNDVKRMATFIENYGSSIDYVALTLDSHEPIHIANQLYWKDAEGYPPALYTEITANDVESGKWTPQYNQSLALPYLRELEKKGECCTIWPAHCVKGSRGWAINEILVKTLYSWNINENRNYELFYKGMNQATEHYSIFKAAVEFDDCEETKLNKKLLAKLEEYDSILIMGEAADYCVANSLKDLLEVSPHLAPRITILTDCCSWFDRENERAMLIYDKAAELGIRFSTSDHFRFETNILKSQTQYETDVYIP